MIVLVDDNEMLLATQQEMLRLHQLENIAFSHPMDALTYLSEPANPATLLITDQDMPELEGTELIQLARMGRPSLPAIVLSGRDEESVELPERAVFLQKPCRIERLTHAMRRLLGSASTPPSQTVND